MFVAFLGCDGSGKSAVIAGMAERLEADGVAVIRGHWRPRAMQRGGGAPAASADDPHGQTPRGLVSSIFKLGWLWVNWWSGWTGSLRRASRDGMVLFDRYHADLLVDPRRYRYGGPQWLARLASRCMPQPDVVVFLDAAPEVLLARKQEVSKEALERARSAYLSFAKSERRIRVIDASAPLEVVIETVLGLVGTRRGLADTTYAAQPVDR